MAAAPHGRRLANLWSRGHVMAEAVSCRPKVEQKAGDARRLSGVYESNGSCSHLSLECDRGLQGFGAKHAAA